ncbi:unnamed protein product [Callosobruchus maculatus]|uniref:Pseudouridine-5'-phosphate glycosidase n=1 Tax=Callosobruchus maculatus TaxID=64391 RepID=A0A653CFN6_CALMS|nr:unnamed protein product [Callosobruchus maculatus]
MLGDTKASNPVKTSRRDLGYVISNQLNGGTTVCGTILVADQVGIPVFATGGIGGVHRGVEKTFDISADLVELGKCGVAVISSGVKSILDIPKTLEYLETQGVFVATFGDNNEFPAFYSRKSGTKSPYFVDSAEKAAQIIKSAMDMSLKSGMLFAVPIPEEHALPYEMMDKVIEQALKSMDPLMEGKQVTPYLLSQVAKLTGGKSLESNIALIKNNAMVAADIAVELAKLRQSGRREVSNMDKSVARRLEGGAVEGQPKGGPVIIGGSNLDCNAMLAAKNIEVSDTALLD